MAGAPSKDVPFDITPPSSSPVAESNGLNPADDKNSSFWNSLGYRLLDAELRQRNLSYDARQKELTRPSLLGVSEKTKASILEATRDVEKANELIENYRNMWPLYSRNDDELAVFSEDYEKQLVADQSSHRLWTVAFSYNSYVECMIRLQQWWAKARMEKRLAGVSAATFEKELIDRAESLRKERLEKENGTGAPGSSIQADGVEHGNEPQALLSNSDLGLN